jgi:hypothetical protein
MTPLTPFFRHQPQGDALRRKVTFLGEGFFSPGLCQQYQHRDNFAVLPASESRRRKRAA